MGAANSQGLAAAKRTAFSEQDQTALYTSAHTDKSRGRKGLGSKSAKLKASQWQGKKLRFDDDEVRPLTLHPHTACLLHCYHY